MRSSRSSRTFTAVRPIALAAALALGAGAFFPVPGRAFELKLDKLDLNKLGKIVSKVIENKDAFVEVDETKEIALGRGIAARLLGAVPMLADEPLQRYVNRVGLWIALQSERPRLPWRFAVLDSDAVNAFAAPGGYVFVTRGLVELMHNEAELAGVLAHEIEHVVRRHHLAAIQNTARTKLTADVVASLVSDDEALADALIGAGMEIYAKGLDRSDELDADRRGSVLAARAGYDPYGLPAVLQSLAAHDGSEDAFALLFSTHPPAVERLDALDAAMDGRFARLEGLQTVDRRFIDMRARLRPGG